MLKVLALAATCAIVPPVVSWLLVKESLRLRTAKRALEDLNGLADEQ